MSSANSANSATSGSAATPAGRSGVVVLTAVVGTILILAFTVIVLCCRWMRAKTSEEHRLSVKEKARRKAKEHELEVLRQLEEGAGEDDDGGDDKKKKKKKKKKGRALLNIAALEEQLLRANPSAAKPDEAEQIQLQQEKNETLGWHRSILSPDGTTVTLTDDALETLVLGKPVYQREAEEATKPLARPGAFLPAPMKFVPVPMDYVPPPWFPTKASEQSARKIQRDFDLAVDETQQALLRPPPLPLLPPEMEKSMSRNIRPLSAVDVAYETLPHEHRRFAEVHPQDFLSQQLNAPDQKKKIALARKKAEQLVLEALRRGRQADGGDEDVATEAAAGKEGAGGGASVLPGDDDKL